MDAYTGEIRMFAGNYAPEGWLLCNGQSLNINDYQMLFALISTIYGGDGRTTFNLPNLQSRVPLHWGQGNGLTNRTIGQYIGSETVTVQSNQLPAHSHSISCNTGNANALSPLNNYISTVQNPSTGTVLDVYDTSGDKLMNPNAVTFSGNSQAHDNVQPFICVSFIICTNGYFPTQN